MRLLLYILRRLLTLVPVVFGVLIIIFVLARMLPADPLHLMVPVAELSDAAIERAIEELGLDRPIYEQFFVYLGNILRGDLGRAYHTGNQVTEDLAVRLPATLELTTLGLLIAVVIAIPLGTLSAVYRDGIVDQITRVVSLMGIAMPAFWLGLLLIFFLYFVLGWLPAPMGRVPLHIRVESITGFFLIDTLLAGNFQGFFAVVVQLIMPVITLSIRSLAVITRLTRSAMIEVLNSDFIRSARGQGINERIIHYRLALKNALLSPITMIGQQYGMLFGGAVIVEIVFAWPGIGMWATNAARAADFNPLQAFAMIAAGLRVIIFLIVDIGYFALDPRIKY